MATHYDAIVVGLGSVGSFALRALAETSQKMKVLGIEAGTLGGTITAAHSGQGLSRIYRRAYFEHTNYVPWVEHSLSVFREMETTSGESLMRQCGNLLLQSASSSTGDHGNNKDDFPDKLPPLLKSSWESATAHNVPVEYLSTDDLKQRFPQFQVDKHQMVGLLEPSGGLLRPERILRVALKQAKSDNITILDDARIANLKELRDLIASSSPAPFTLSLESERHGISRTVSTDKLLVCMGGWTSDLISAWKNFLFPVRQVQSWIETNDNIYSAEYMPAFVYVTPDYPQGIYGLPCDNGADSFADGRSASQWLKVGTHNQDTSAAFSFANHPSTATEDEIDELSRVISLAINPQAWDNGDRPTITASKPCLYTMSSDHNFIIGSPSPDVFAIAGLSGHGFKMAPSLGQMLAEFALGENVEMTWNTNFCSPRRFDG